MNKCQTSKVENNTNNQIKASILKRAAVLKKEEENKKKGLNNFKYVFKERNRNSQKM